MGADSCHEVIKWQPSWQVAMNVADVAHDVSVAAMSRQVQLSGQDDCCTCDRSQTPSADLPQIGHWFCEYARAHDQAIPESARKLQLLYKQRD